MKKAKEFLEALTVAFPAGENQHHALFTDGGKLGLALFQDKNFQTVMFDDEDFERPTEELVADVLRVIEDSGKPVEITRV